MKSSIISVAALAAVGSAMPTKRAAVTDADILNYALTLEHLEDTFYRQGLQKFKAADFISAGFTNDTYNKVMTIASDEATHVSFLTSALKAAGATPVAECTYNFGVTDVKSFLATASVLEGVGVSAYLGAAADIMSKTYLTAAGSILTVEARHSAYIRNSNGQEPFAQPFDVPLSLNSVYTLAAPFIVSCPSTNPPLPVKAFPTLSATGASASITAGTTLTLTTPGAAISGTPSAAFITVTGPIFVPVTAAKGGYTVQVPQGIAGESFLVLTSCSTAATDDTIIAGPAIVEIAGTA